MCNNTGVDEDNDFYTDYCFSDDDTLKYCSCTYNDTVFPNVDIGSHLRCIYNTVLFNNYMISNMKREECNPKTNIITSDKHYILKFMAFGQLLIHYYLQATYCCMMCVYKCTSIFKVETTFNTIFFLFIKYSTV